MSIFVDIEKKLGDFHLQVRFSGGDGVMALLGASGSGKSLTLRCIAGIETPDRGRIEVDGVTLFDSEKGIHLSPQRRRTGLLFQNYALFPNMTVRKNLEAGARQEKDASRRRELTEEFLDRFGLRELENRLPSQLSGGQQQRVALARVLISAPNILLLDEPFSALDSHLRFQLEQELREHIRSFGKTVLLVSHDRDEVYRLSDEIAVMNRGKVEVFGERREVFANPRTRTAAILTGCKNISRAEPVDETHVYAVDWGMKLALPQGEPCPEYLGIRMHDLTRGKGENGFVCCILQKTENPFSDTFLLRPEGTRGTVGWVPEIRDLSLKEGQKVEICLPKEKILRLRG